MANMAEMWGGDAAGDDGERGGWFRDMKYAMFIHWGLYSQLGGRWQGRTYYGNAEWIMNRAKIPVREYEVIADEFNPVRFDAREWVQLAKDAGMRYIVITAKHHDGFAMYKSAASTFNIVDATPFGRDPLLELAEACAEADLRLGFYYSQYQDWHEADAAGNSWDFDGSGDFNRYLHGKAMPQIRELLTGYGPIALIWFDTPGSITPEASEELFNLVHELQPDCLVNSRVGNGFGDYSSTGDQEIPLTIRPGLWESIDTHNDTWGYGIDDENWDSASILAGRLLKVAAKGGTYMLNVGPTGEGIIPPQSAAILRELGAWITPRAEAIYGTRPWADASMPWGEITRREDTLYLHVLQVPPDGRLWLPGVEGDVTETRLVGEAAGEAPSCSRIGNVLAVDLPAEQASALGCVVALRMVKPRSCPTPLVIVNGIDNYLDAPFAKLAGCQQRTHRWMEKFGEWHYTEAIAHWEPGATATWRVQTFAPGRFYLVADYATELQGDGSEFDILVGDQVRRFLAIDTGDRPDGDWICRRSRFRRRRIAMLDLPGPVELPVRLVHLDAAASPTVSIQRLALVPVG